MTSSWEMERDREAASLYSRLHGVGSDERMREAGVEYSSNAAESDEQFTPEVTDEVLVEVELADVGPQPVVRASWWSRLRRWAAERLAALRRSLRGDPPDPPPALDQWVSDLIRERLRGSR